MVGLTAAARIGTLNSGEVEIFDHGGNVAGQVGFWQQIWIYFPQPLVNFSQTYL